MGATAGSEEDTLSPRAWAEFQPLPRPAPRIPDLAAPAQTGASRATQPGFQPSSPPSALAAAGPRGWLPSGLGSDRFSPTTGFSPAVLSRVKVMGAPVPSWLCTSGAFPSIQKGAGPGSDPPSSREDCFFFFPFNISLFNGRIITIL